MRTEVPAFAAGAADATARVRELRPESRPIRVLHVLDSLGVGGTELALAALIERTHGHLDHRVCCVRAAGPTATRLASMGVAVDVLGKTPGHDWSLPLRFARLCRVARPDVVHTRNWGSIDAIVGARLARVPVVLHGEHGRDAGDPNGTNRRRNRARRILSRLCNRVVAVSEQLGRWLVDDVGINGGKVVVLRNGVDAARFDSPADRPALRAAHGHAPDDIVVGTVGRLDPVKNQRALIEVASRLARSHPEVCFTIVGDGPEGRALQAEIDGRGISDRVRLAGHRDDVPEVLRTFDLFVLPSLGEGMCNTILEAMASALPVVATRVGGNPEMVEDGVTGRLVASGDVGALASAIEVYADDAGLRRNHGSAGRERVLREFTLDAMVRRYLALYERETGDRRCAA